MKKEVQKSVWKFNLNLSIYNHIKKGLRPSQICKKLNIKKTTLQYHLSSLKRNGFIKKIGYGVWEILKDFDEKEVQKSVVIGKKSNDFISIKPDTSRGHAFMFNLEIKKDLRNWDKREEILSKLGITFKDYFVGGIKRGQQFRFKDKVIQLTNKSIIIQTKESFLGDTAKESQNYAIADLICLIKALEGYMKADFSFNGKYRFKVSRQHYSLVKNALAKQYDREGKKLQVYNDSGLWFLIDNSFNLHEAETVHQKTAVSDNGKVQTFFNGIKDLEGYTPAFVTNTMQGIQQNQMVFAENMKSHIKAIQDLGKGVRKLTKVVGIKEKLKKQGKNRSLWEFT